MLQQQTELKTKVLRLLDEHQFMTVATLRGDGWPQATMVGYVHDDLTLYFAVALVSQKLSNIKRDGRISIALGHDEPTRLRGLSIAAHAEPVTLHAEIEAVNELLRERYQGRVAFSPRATASVLVRAEPIVISIIDLGKGPGEPELISVSNDGEVRRISTKDRASGAERQVTVRTVRPDGEVHRPGAPP
jgi:general stress protein 26